MGKKYIGGFTDGYGFKRTANKPIDDSTIVEFIIDLTNGTIDKPYPMMIVGVLEDLNHYKWNGLDVTNISNWINISTASGSDATTLQGLSPDSQATADAHIVATDSAGNARVSYLLTSILNSDDIVLTAPEETLEPAQTNTVTLMTGSVLKKVPLSLFKAYLTSAGLNATTLGGRSLSLSGNGNTIPYRDANGLLFATGIGINGAFAQANILRGDGTVTPITKAEIDALGVNAGYLSGRNLNFAPTGNTVAGRDTDGSLSAVLFKLDSWDLKQIAGTLVFRSDSLGFQAQFPTTKSGTVAYLIDIPDNTELFGIADTAWANLPMNTTATTGTLEYRVKTGRLCIKGNFTGILAGEYVIGTLPISVRPDYDTNIVLRVDGLSQDANCYIDASSGEIIGDIFSGTVHNIGTDVILKSN